MRKNHLFLGVLAAGLTLLTEGIFAVAQGLAESLGQQVIVENRGGGGGPLARRLCRRRVLPQSTPLI